MLVWFDGLLFIGVVMIVIAVFLKGFGQAGLLAGGIAVNCIAYIIARTQGRSVCQNEVAEEKVKTKFAEDQLKVCSGKVDNLQADVTRSKEESARLKQSMSDLLSASKQTPAPR